MELDEQRPMYLDGPGQRTKALQVSYQTGARVSNCATREHK